MIDVTIAIPGAASTQPCASHWRCASAIGSNASGAPDGMPGAYPGRSGRPAAPHRRGPPTREARSVLNTIIIVLVVLILAVIAWHPLTGRRV
jgi:hypothetical protein